MKKENTFMSAFAVTTLSAILAACASSSGGNAASASSTDAQVLALVTGTLTTSDPAQAQAAHDQAAGALKPQGQAAGDVSHDALLAKDVPPSTRAPAPLDFLAIDRWTSASSATAFYASAQVQNGFTQLFAAPPDVSVWVPRDGWTSWGTSSLVQTDPNAYAITLRGKFQGTVAQAQVTHNGLVAAVPAPGPVGQGNIAHLPMANPNDPTDLLIVEIWDNETNQEALYSNPQFQQALSQFWVGQPTVARWQNPSWMQW